MGHHNWKEDKTRRSILKLFTVLTGLLSVMFAYVSIGASVFKLMEAESTRDENRFSKAHIARLKFLDELELLHTSFKTKTIDHENATFRVKLYQVLYDFEKILSEEASAGDFNRSAEKEWTYEASVLYAASLVTTVGYGNLVPRTSQGRIFTITYSIVGIPLTLVCIHLMGTILARGFKATSLYIFEDMVTEEGEAYVPLKASALVVWIYLCVGAILFRTVEPGWTFLEAFYFCFITLSTIGLGDYVYGENSKTGSSLIVSTVYLLFGLALLSMCFSLMQEQANYTIHTFIGSVKKKMKRVCPGTKPQGSNVTQRLSQFNQRLSQYQPRFSHVNPRVSIVDRSRRFSSTS